MNKNSFDYVGSLYASRILAKSIEMFWLRKGHSDVKVWVEKETFGNTPIYTVRSNIRFEVPNGV